MGCFQNQDNAGQDEITGSAIEETSENCRFSDPSDCSPIEIARIEQTEEETDDEVASAGLPNITDKPEYNITLQNLTSLSLACEAGWKCIKGKYIAYQEGNCSWHSLERCIHGCNENESMCRLAPICKVNSLKCENDNLMICGGDGHKWLLNKSCEKDCENNMCTEDLPVNATNATLNITTNITTNVSNNATNTTSNSCSTCISIINFQYNGGNDSNCQYLNNEYVTFRNICPYSCDLKGWTVNDASSNNYIFPAFTLDNGNSFTLHTGNGNNTQTELYWNRCQAVWNNNNGDTLYLNTLNGTSVLICPYPNNGSILNCPDL